MYSSDNTHRKRKKKKNGDHTVFTYHLSLHVSTCDFFVFWWCASLYLQLKTLWICCDFTTIMCSVRCLSGATPMQKSVVFFCCCCIARTALPQLIMKESRESYKRLFIEINNDFKHVTAWYKCDFEMNIILLRA